MFLNSLNLKNKNTKEPHIDREKIIKASFKSIVNRFRKITIPKPSFINAGKKLSKDALINSSSL